MHTEEKPKKKRLSKKQRGFIKDYVETGNGTQSALKNYDTKDYKTASVIATENLDKPSIRSAIDEALSDELLAKVHKEGLEANKVISANITYGDADEKTNDFIEIPDHATRAKFLDMGYKVKGRYAAEKHVTLNIAVEPSERIRELADMMNEQLRYAKQGEAEPVPQEVLRQERREEESGE